MKTKYFEKVAQSFFSESVLAFFKEDGQFGFNNYFDKEIKKVGVSVNLTIDIINQAKDNNVDLILTHHNVWDEMLEMADDCKQLLKEYKIIHYFNHLPLDASDFGPTRSLAEKLDVNIINNISYFGEYSFGIVGEFKNEINLNELKSRLETICGHNIRVWKNNDKLIKRVGIVSGSGGNPQDISDACIYKSDAFITGEKKLKTVLYAKHQKINFLLSSHIFTEVFGIRAYAKLINEKMLNVEFMNLKEEHIE